MKNKYTTLEEEINRIKSLITEERLYGNLIDEETLSTKQLILENAPGRLIGDFLESVWDGFIKKNIKKKVAKNAPDVVYNIDADGVVRRNGEIIDPSDITQIITPKLKSRIGTQLDSLNTKEKFVEYLTGSGDFSLRGNVIDIINDLELQTLISPRIASDLRSAIDRTGIYNTINSVFKDAGELDKFNKSINSDLEFMKKYPEVYEIFNIVPNAKRNYYDIINRKKLIPNESYSLFEITSTIQDYIKKNFKSGDKPTIKLDMETPGELKISELDSAGNVQEMGDELDKNIEDLVNELTELDSDLEITKNTKGEWVISIGKLDPEEIDVLDKIVNKFKKPKPGNIDNIVKTTEELADSDKSSIIVRKLDLGDDAAEKSVRAVTNKGVFDDNYIYTIYRKNFLQRGYKEFRLALKNFWNTKAGATLTDLLRGKVAKGVDIEWLKRNDYRYSSSGSKNISNDQADVLRDLYEVPGNKNESIFVDGANEINKYGLPQGSIKPSVKAVDNFDQKLKEKIISIINLIKIPKGKMADATGYAKMIRSIGITGGAILSIVKFVELALYWGIYLWTEFRKRQTKAIRDVTVDQLLEEGINPTLILPIWKSAYQTKCKENFKKKLLSIYKDKPNFENQWKLFFESGGKMNNVFDVDYEPKNLKSEVGLGIMKKWDKAIEELKTSRELDKKSATWSPEGFTLDNFGVVTKKGDIWGVILDDDKSQFVSLVCEPTFKKFIDDEWKKAKEAFKDEQSITNSLIDKGDAFLKDEDGEDKTRIQIIKDYFKENSTQDIITNTIKSGVEKAKETQEKVISTLSGGGGRTTNSPDEDEYSN